MKTIVSPTAAPDDAERLAAVDVGAVEQDWPVLLGLLPPDWEARARSTGAFQRRRGVPDASAFLRLIFAYSYCRLSLRLTVFWAEIRGVAALSEVALRKRLCRAKPWIGELLAAKLARHAPLPGQHPPGLRIRLVDATCVRRPGSTGTDYRLHVGFDLERLTVDQVELTTAAGGETLKRLPARPGEITIADRGYSQRQGIAALSAQGGAVLVRVNSGALPLEHPDGQCFELLAALRGLEDTAVGDWAVQTAPAADGTPAVSGRLVALRKSPQATEAARRKLQAEARRKGRTPDARSLELAGYVVLFTTVSPATLSGVEILNLYRFRWQIELAFKRMKTHLSLAQLPAKDPDLCQTFLLTQLLAAVLVDELTHRWVDFSPEATDPERPPSLWRVYQAVSESLRQLVGAILTPAEWLQVRGRTRGLRDTPRRRLNQGAEARRLPLFHAPVG